MTGLRKCSWVAAWLLALSVPVFAQAPAAAPAVTRAAGDPALMWGPCPAFMPAGCGIAVLNGDPARPNADVFFKVPGGSVIPEHWHTSAERMVLVSGELHVTYKGQPTAVLKSGMYAFGPAKLSHNARCASKDPCVLFIAFEQAVDAVETK